MKKTLAETFLDSLEQCCCDKEQDRYNSGYSSVNSDPNEPDYDEFEQENEPEQYKPDVTRNQNWANNPIRNTKDDIMYGAYALENYVDKIKDVIVRTNKSFYNTPQYKDIINNFNDSFNKALLNLAIACDTSTVFLEIINNQDNS